MFLLFHRRFVQARKSGVSGVSATPPCTLADTPVHLKKNSLFNLLSPMIHLFVGEIVMFLPGKEWLSFETNGENCEHLIFCVWLSPIYTLVERFYCIINPSVIQNICVSVMRRCFCTIRFFFSLLLCIGCTVYVGGSMY